MFSSATKELTGICDTSQLLTVGIYSLYRQKFWNPGRFSGLEGNVSTTCEDMVIEVSTIV